MRDPAAETAVLSSLLEGGKENYLEIVDILNDSNMFSISENSLIFSCIKHCYAELDQEKLEMASIFSAAQLLGISDFVNQPKVQKHLYKLFDFVSDPKHLRVYAAKLRRIHAIKIIRSQLDFISEQLSQFTGDEKISEILTAVETPIFELPSKIGNQEDEIIRIPDVLEEYIRERLENPTLTNGISTGFPLYDAAVGGGMAPGDLHVISASAKNYKTGLIMNMANHMAGNGVKVLIIDTELRIEQQLSRLLAMESGVATNDIRTGKFGSNEKELQGIRDAFSRLRKKELDFVSVAGKPFDEVMSILRRWYYRNIGKVDPCIFIFDYLKVPAPDSGKNSDYEQLGYMTSVLKDFSTNHEISALALCQRNRSGSKSNDDTEFSVGDSYRIVQYCSSLSVFRKKLAEEEAEHGKENGNQLLRVCASRDGAGSDFPYINYKVNGECMQINELGLLEQKQDENSIEYTDGNNFEVADIEF